jgi:hypothetical protein
MSRSPLLLTSAEHAIPELPMEFPHAPQFQASARVF